VLRFASGSLIENRKVVMYKSTVPTGCAGEWAVERYEVTEAEANLGRLRASIGNDGGRFVPAGRYTMLKRGARLVMSDTPDEIRDHYGVLSQAQQYGGNVLVAGLGLGVVIDLVLVCDNIEHVTVIEKSSDVISLVGPHMLSRHPARLTIHKADVFEWKPPRDQRYSVAWFDIWNNICSTNLVEMKKLERKYVHRAKWCGCWGQSQCRRAK